MLHDIRRYKPPQTRRIAGLGAAMRGAKDVSGATVPHELLADYDLCPDGLERMSKLRRANADRATNVLRSWHRAQTYLPELLTSDPQDVLELSTTHGAMLEVMRHYGHRVMGTDYAPSVWSSDPSVIKANLSVTERPDWPYRHVIDSVEVPMTLFDARTTPHPFKDKSFDCVICDESIAHYSYPDDWMELVAEFCRVSRRTVFVMLSPLTPYWRADAEYRCAFDRFRTRMERYQQNGFTCTTTFTEHCQVLGFKLTAPSPGGADSTE